MIPLNKGIYTVDIETKPLPQYDKNYKKIDSDNSESELQEVDSPGLLPWCSEIYGMSVAWGDDFDKECAYFTGDDIKVVVEILSKEKLKLGAHNIFFDWVNLYYHFNLPLNFVVDSGVISQCINNSDFIQSFGLKQTVERLYNVITQDIELKEYLKIHHRVAPSKYGEFIHLCPPEMIAKYCKLDSHYCWRIINDCKRWLKSDIRQYMKFYVAEVKMTMMQFIEGILVDRAGLLKEKNILTAQINDIYDKFMNHPELKPHIEQIQQSKFEKTQAGYKKKILVKEDWEKDNPFNINSTAQLKELFDAQKLHWNESKQKFEYPYVNTLPGTKYNNPLSPKLGTKFLHAYGVGGEILADKGEKATLISHIERALDESELDNKIHAHVNLLGTKSGRISGSGVNIIATPISDEQYGKYLIVEDDWEIMSTDYLSLEPTILACLSNDPVLKYATYEGQGKEPFFKDGVLWIDDIYVSAAYSASFMRREIEDKLDLTNWVKNSDAEKKKIKFIRSLSKTIVLASNYGASALKVQQTVREQLKVTIPLKDIKTFQESYWSTFAVAAQYKRHLEQKVLKDGYIINLGGFPLTFYDRPGGVIQGEHKALNRVIQSSAAVCMKLLLYFIYPMIRNRNDIIPLVSDWHDASWFKIRKGIEEEVKQIILKALEQVNETLKLPLKLRLDFNIGESFYHAK